MKRLTYLLIACCLASCGAPSIFEGKMDFDKNGWSINAPAKFEFDITNIDQAYDLYLHVRVSEEYPYRNLYVKYYLEDSTGNVLDSELNNILLFDSKTGEPLGGGLGSIYDIQKKFIQDYHFNTPGHYQFRVEQFMRQDALPGIHAVGIKVSPLLD